MQPDENVPGRAFGINTAPLTGQPLSGHRFFVASTVSELEREFESKVAARIVYVSPDAYSLAHRCVLPAGGQLWYGVYRGNIKLQFQESDFLRVQVQLAGVGRTTVGRTAVEITGSQSCISPAQSLNEYGPGFSQFVWRVPNSVLTQRLFALAGAPVSRKLSFTPTVARSSSYAGIFESILASMLTVIDQFDGAGAELLLAELESAAIVTLLLNGHHNMSHLLTGRVNAAAPWQVRRVEEYIEAHWNQPFDIERITADTGLSGRSIYRAFRRWRGYSPNEFAKRRRLERAREILSDANTRHSVTGVAALCGFSDLSHFSREYRRAFGDSPSVRSSRRPA